MMGQPTTKELLTWPLVQQLYSRVPVLPTVNPGVNPLSKDARLVNAYAEKVPGTQSDYWVFKRLGAGPPFQSQAGFPGGSYTYNSQAFNSFPIVFTVVGGALYVNGVLVPGFATQQNMACFFETLNSNPQDVVIMPGYGSLAAYVYNTNNGVLTPITDATFTAINRVPGMALLDGWLFVMDANGTIWNTNTVNQALVWNALNSIQASSRADQGVYLTTQLNYVVALKQWSTQVFYDASAQILGQGSPLAPVPDAQIPHGCLHPLSVQKIDEGLLWVSYNQTISPQVIFMNNLQPEIVSSPSVERILDNFVSLTRTLLPSGFFNPGIYSWSIKHAGHRFYGLTLPLLNITLVFDIDQRLWNVWTDSNGNYWPFAYFSYQPPNFATGTEGVHLAQAINSVGVNNIIQGYQYQLDGDYSYPTDNGLIFPVDIYTPNTDFGTLRTKLLNMMYFESDIVKGSKMLARYTDDDFNSWTNFREIRLDIDRPELDDEGSFVRRAYHFRHALATKFRIKSSGLDMTLGIL